MNEWKKCIPDGTRDVIFDECTDKSNIENKIRNIYMKRGYKEIKSPTLEFYDVFNVKNQPIKQEKMYKLFDAQGRILVLRPDMTMPIARIVSSKIQRACYPIKICYTANVFRINESLYGKMGEITQSGIEIIGTKDIKADIELFITAINSMVSIGIKNFKIEIGQNDFYKSIVEESGINEVEIKKLTRLVENKNFAGVRNFVNKRKDSINENSVEVLKKLPELFGGIEVLYQAEKLTNNKKALKALKNIREIYEVIDQIGFSKYLSIDLGMVQHINYYTGVIFRGYVSETGGEFLRGGRYDKLLKEFGVEMPATGFSINIDSIMKSIKKEKKNLNELYMNCYVYCEENNLFSEAYNLVENMEERNIKAEIGLAEDEKKAVDYCKNFNIESMLSVIDYSNIKLWNIKKETFKKLSSFDKEKIIKEIKEIY